MKTVIIQIGNSDNKLTQQEWAYYIKDIDQIIYDLGLTVHFRGGSPFDTRWQNSCWVCEINENSVANLKSWLEIRRESYNQESIALTIGETQFV